MKKNFKKLLIRLIILIIVLLSLLIIVEFCLNLLNKKNSENAWYRENDVINKMNVDKLQNKNWTSNPLWLYEGEELSPKKDGVKRILIVGDSFIWGDGYSNANHIWWKQFSHLLKENGYGNVEVIAAGLGGLSTKEQLNYILKNNDLMDKVNPDFIIIGFVNNDVEFRNENYELMVKAVNSVDLFENSDNFFIKNFKKFFPNIYRNICILFTNKFQNNDEFQKKFGLNYYSWLETISSGSWLEKYKNESLIPLKEYLENELKIPYFMYMTTINKDPGNENVRSLFKNLKIPYYYFPHFYDYLSYPNVDFSNSQKINPVNWHPSVFYCKLFAERLLKIMQSYYSEFLGERNYEYIPEFKINDWMPYKLNVKKIDKNKYSFVYPNINNSDNFLFLPIEKKYIKLNLEDPIDINQIIINSKSAKSIDLYINVIDKNLNFDTQVMISLGEKKSEFVWNLTDDYLVTSINISVDLKDKNDNYFELVIE